LAELGFTLLAKDRIKETLHDWLGDGPSDLAWSRRLGAASMELLWTLAAGAPSVVLEANFLPDDPRNQIRAAALAARPVEVFCQCPEQEAMRRYAERGSSRHAVHLDGRELRMSAETFARSDHPLGIGPVITVATTQPIDIPALAREVRLLLPGAPDPPDPPDPVAGRDGAAAGQTAT
jgi:hypothetical protein